MTSTSSTGVSADLPFALAAFVAGDADGLVAALAPDAVFHCPVADYAGRETYEPVLRAVMGLVRDVSVTSACERPGEAVAFLTATVDGHPVDGVLRATGEAGSPPADLTLMIRPLEALLAAVRRMREALS